MKKLVVALTMVAMILVSMATPMSMLVSAEEQAVYSTPAVAVGDITTAWSEYERPTDSAYWDGWTPIGTYDELVTAFASGNDGGQYYLTNNITIGSSHLTANQVNKNFTFDGNGYSFVFEKGTSRAVFNTLSGATIQNLKLEGEFEAHTRSGVDTSPLGSEYWSATGGTVNLINIYSTVNVYITNTSRYKYVSGVISSVGANSSFKDVVYEGKIISETPSSGIGKVNDVAGIVAQAASGTTFENCYANVEITMVNGTINTGYDKNYTHFAGIAAWAEGTSSFNNCAAVGTISIDTPSRQCTNYDTSKADITLATWSDVPTYAGGIVGQASGAATITDCISDVAITYGENASSAGAYIGGIAGTTASGSTISGSSTGSNAAITINSTINGESYIAMLVGRLNTGNVDGCTTNGAINFSAELNSQLYLGGIAGHNNGGTAYIKNTVNNADITLENLSGTPYVCAVAGIIARTNAALQIENCENNGNITLDSTVKFHGNSSWGLGVGGIFGNGGNVTISNTDNNGDITVATDATPVGGIVGYSSATTTLDGCNNTGAISCTWSLAVDIDLTDNGVDDEGNATNTENDVSVTHTNTVAGSVGGLVGSANATTTIKNSTSSADMTLTVTSTGAMTAAADNKTALKYTVNAAVGGIIGSVNNATTLQNVQATADASTSISVSFSGVTITGSSLTTSATQAQGGFIGGVYANVTLDGDCVNNCNTYSDGVYVGGFVGYIGAAATVDGNGATNAANISEKNAGGVVGLVAATATVQNFNNTGNITGTNVAGGIVARNNAAITIDSCTNTGTIRDSFRAGGILAWANAGSTVTNCVNGVDGSNATAAVSVTSPDPWSGVGGIVGYVASGTCTVKGSTNHADISSAKAGGLSGSNDTDGVGGIIGHARSAVVVGGETEGDQCVNNGNITSKGVYAGGIIGHARSTLTVRGANASNLTVNTGTVTASGATVESGGSTVCYVGGIAGKVKNTSTLAYLENTGTVSGSSASTATDGVGGIVGAAAAACTFNGCTNYGPITGNAGKTCVGGILGYTDKKVSVSDCHNQGTITTKFTGGGIVGWTDTNVGHSITNCTNGVSGDATKGAINATESGDYVGGIAGALHYGTANNCTNYGPVTQVGGNYVGGITGEIKTGGNVDNCINKGDVTNPSGNAGGITATMNGDLVVDGCRNEGNITGSNMVGGLFGTVSGTLTATNCINGNSGSVDSVVITNPGEVSSTGAIGGIVAQVIGVAKFEGCYNYAKLYNPNNNGGTYYGAKYVGGIIGWSGKTEGTTTTMYESYVGYDVTDVSKTGTGCFNYGSIDTVAFGHTAYIGGIAGYVGGGSKFYGSENHGNMLLGNKGGSTNYHGAGGILGYTNAAADTITYITNCKNTGDIAVKDGNTLMWVAGGIMGGNWSNATFATVIDGCTNSGTINTEYSGGIVGRATGVLTVSNSTNTGHIIADMNGNYGIGGIVAEATSTLTVTGCTNDGPITSTGTHTGGIVGHSASDVTVTDCENTENGVITFTDNSTTMTGVGGIIGYAQGDTKTATISYCINDGAIVPGTDATGNQTHIGGILGRGANPIYYTISYCINNGDLKAATVSTSYVGGIVGLNQAFYGTESYVATIENCTNTGDLYATYAGGLLGYSNIGSGAATAYCCFTATNCTNTGNVYGSKCAAGFAAYNSSTYTWDSDGDGTKETYNAQMIYTITDCVNTGAISTNTGVAAGAIARMDNVEATVTDCAIAGSVTAGTTGSAYVLAPVSSSYDNYTDSFTGCTYLSSISATNTTYVATAKSSDDIRTIIRGENTATVIFDRDNAKALYQWAEARNDDSLADLMAALVPYIENSGHEYFETEQWRLDAAYQALYDTMYAGAVTSFIITIDDSIELKEDGGSLTLAFTDPTPLSKLTVKVSQSGLADGANFTLAGNVNNTLEFWLMQGEKIVKNNQNLFEFDWSSQNGNYTFGAQIKNEETLYPDVYTGTLTFTVTYSEVEAIAE